MKKHLDAVFRKVFVNGFATSLPVSVVVNYQHASRNEAREKLFQFATSGLIPVRIQPQDCDLIRRFLCEGIFYFAFDVSDTSKAK